MATIEFTKQNPDRRVDIVTWANLGQGDDGQPYVAYNRPDKTIQILGSFDSTTVLFEGSNDGSNWETLTDADGSACSFTGADLVFVREAPFYVRPIIDSDGGSGDITIIMVAATQGRDW